MRSFFIIYPQLCLPKDFKPQVAPELLTQQDLWQEARRGYPALLFRVRSSSDPGVALSASDRLESCVGLIDSTTRWRVVFSMARSMLNVVQHPQMKDVLTKALQFISSVHPASVTVDTRRAVVNDIAQLLSREGDDAPADIEKMIAAHVAQLVGADNDVEAAQMVPFTRVLCPFSSETQREEFQARMATLETVAGAVLMTEASNRLGERIPQWLVAPMPRLEVSGAAEESDEGPRGDE
jgi:hypothetical protein